MQTDVAIVVSAFTHAGIRSTYTQSWQAFRTSVTYINVIYMIHAKTLFYLVLGLYYCCIYYIWGTGAEYLLLLRSEILNN